MMDLYNLVVHAPAIPDSKLPVHNNVYTGPVKSNVNYNYRPVQALKVQAQKTSYMTQDMEHYIPIENGGI